MSLLKKSINRKILGSIFTILLLANFIFLSLNMKSVFASPGLATKWTRSLGSNAQTYIGPLAADINGDGKLEIVVTGGSSDDPTYRGTGLVTAMDGATGNIVWQVTVGGVTRHTPFEIADINNDGLLEIIVSGSYPTVLRGSNGAIYWQNTAVSSYSLYSPVADIDGDGFYEIFVSSGRSPWIGDDYFTMLSYDGKVLRQQNGSWHPCWGGLTIGDANFDGRFELYQGDRRYGYSTDTPYIYGEWGVRCLDALTLTPLWNDSDITCSSHCPILADVDKDGILDVIVTHQSSGSGGLAVYRAADGSVLTTGGKNRKGLSLGLASHSQPTVADIDGDGNLEIITCKYTNPKIWDLYDWKLDATLPIVCIDPPKVGDVTGDGKLDIIAATGSEIYIYSYDEVSKTYVQVDHVTASCNAFTLVQDVDGDGYNELITTSAGGTVRCFDTTALAPNPRVRSNLQFYSERHLGAAEYVPPPGPQAPQISEPSPSDTATNVPISLSQLTFKLTDYQQDPINYTVTTNPDIGSGSGINVPNAKYTVPISGLAYSTTYTWTITATDGTNTNTKTFTFTTSDLPPWYNTDWQYRRTIIIDHTKVSGTQTNFPVVIDLTDSNLKTKAQPDGDDFLFTDQNHNKLNHQIELYDSTTGHLIAWVNIPLLSSTTDTTLYMYYGNPTCENQQNTIAVWDTSHKLVLHLDEKTGIHYDSTLNSNNGTPLNGVAQGVTAKIDGGDTFDGTNDYIEVPHSDNLAGYTEAFTASFWIRLEDTSRRQAILNKYNSGTNQRGWFIEYNPVDRPTRPFGFYASPDGTNYREWYASFVPAANTWYYITVVWEANTAPKFYVNGVQVPTVGTATISSIYNNVGVPLHIARSTYNTARYLKGSLDEIRISNPARSADYILTCYNNQLNPSTFYTISAEEALPGEPMISDPYPTKDVTNIPVTLTELSFNLTDYQNDPMNFTVTTNPDIGTWTQTNVPNGRYSVPVSGLAYSRIYNWTVTVTDGTYTTTRTYSFTTELAPAADDIIFNSNFDMGNLINVTYQNGAPGYRNYTAAVKYSTVSFADKHWWFYFSMDNVASKTVTITIQNGTTADYSTSQTSGNRWPEIEPVYSYDNINWQRVPLSGVTFNRAARSFTINVTVPIGHSKIWLAPLPPYNIDKRDALFAEFASSPYLTVASLGTTPGGQQLKVATITDPAYPDVGKFKSYVIAQQHAVEVPGSWNAEGLIRYLLSDDPTAAAIRRSYIFKIVPIVNVDGVYQGVCRYTPLRSGVQYDLNREWTKAVSSMQPEIRLIWQDLLAFKPNSFNDMHSTINTEVGSPKEALTYTWSTSDPTIIAFRAKIKLGGYPETVTGVTSYACTVVHNNASLGNIKESVSWENPHDELSSNPGVKLTVNDWMSWGAGWAKGNYLYFGDAKAVLTVSTVGNGSVAKNPDNATYPYGASVQLTATAGVGYTFSHWTGDLTGNLNPATILMNGNKSVTAVFIESEYSLTINVEGGGSVSRNDTGPYYHGSVVQLTAIADPNWTFSEWSGNLSGITNPAVIVMTGNMLITAHFTGQQYTITASVTGTGGNIEPSGSIIVTHGQDQTFTMNPDVGYHVSDVLIDDLSVGPSLSYTFYAVDQGHTITAVFAQNEYTLTVNIIGSGSTIKNPEKTTYTHGETVELTAIANTGWTFSGWSGDLTGLTNPAMISMTGNKTVTATFTNNQWLSIDWKYRRTITIDRTKVSGTQTNFPILIDLTDSSLIGKAQLDGDDFLFTSSDNVKLNHEIELYDSTIGRLIVWINVPSISSTADTVLYMYYGNPTCGNQQNPAVVWDTSFKLVLHLDEKTGMHYDSTTNGNNGTPLNGVLQGVTGKIDGADTFDGINDYIEIPHSTTLTGYTQAFTSSFWIKLEDTSRRQAILNKYNQGTNQRGWFIEYNPVDRPTRPFGFYASPDGTNYREWYANFVPTAGVWYHITVVWEANTIPKFYINGAQVSTVGTATISTIYNNVGVPLHIGRCTYNTARYFKGSLDEITISNPARSASWILTNYNNQKDPSTFYAVGAEESFKESYTLAIIIDGHGSVKIDPEKTYYTSGETVTLTATPDTGYEFTGWTGDLTGITNPATITMTANMIITAHFVVKQYTINASVTGVGGTIDPSGLIVVTHGQNQTLTITPNTGYHILDIAVDGESQGPLSTYTFYAVDNNHTITATFAQTEYTLTVTASPTEGGTVNLNNTGPYYYGDVVRLEAVPSTGWAFSHWNGDLSGGANPTTITINDNKSVTAVFAQNQYTLTITTDGSGQVTKDPDQATYPYGTNVTLTANAYPGWSFSHWSGDLTGSANPATLNITDHKTVTAHFTQDQYTLTVKTDGSGSVSRNASEPYYYGTVVELTAVPDAGWSFSEWTGDIIGSVNPATIEITGNMTVTAHFAQDQYTLTIEIAGHGSVEKNPNIENYTYGEIVTLTASADIGWSFSGWSGDLTGVVSPADINMTGNKSVTANFTQNVYTLTVTISPEGSGSVALNYTGPYHYGDTVELTANPAVGYSFSEWIGDLSGSDSPTTIVIDGNKHVTATFELTNRPPQIDLHTPETDPTILEGDSQEFSITYSDPDNDPVQVQWYINDTPTSTLSTYTFTSDYTSAGTYNITVTITDGLALATHQWTLTVTDVGPVLDMPLDTDTNPTPDNSGYNNNGIVINATWTTAGNGSYYFDGAINATIKINDSVSLDGDGNWDQITIEFWLYITAPNQNGKRIIAKRGSTSGTYSYQVGFQTANGRLYFDVWNPNLYEVEWTTLPSVNTWYHIVCVYKSGEGSKIYINGVDINAVKVGTGSESGNIAKSRGQALFLGCRYGTQDYFTGIMDNVKIFFKGLPIEQIVLHYDASKNDHVNKAPVITSFTPADPEPQVDEGQSLQFTHTSMDPERNPLTYLWILDHVQQATTQNWAYTPSFDDAGFHNVTLVVSDGSLITTQYWNVTVRNVNRAPIITDYYPDTDPRTPEGQSQEFNITCSDPDGDNLLIQWYLDNTPVGTQNSTSHTFSGSAGTYDVSVQVSDGLTTVWHNWTLTVTSGNTPPSIESVTISPKPAYNDNTLTATPNGWFDPDGDPEGYVYQWQKWDSTEWQNITGATSQTLDQSNFANSDIIRVMCTPYDGKDYGETKYDTVTIENRAPTITSYTPTVDYPCINTTQQQTFTVTATDPDGDALNHAWYADGVLNTTASSYLFEAVSGTAGVHNITLRITDGHGGQARHVWFLTIDAVLVMPFDTNISPATDYAGYDNNGTVSGAIWNSSGRIGGGYSFDGTNDYISIPHSTSLDGNGTWTQITVEFWIKLATASQNAKKIIAKRDPRSSGGNYSYQVGFQTSTGRLYFDIWNAATYYEVEYTTLLTANTWYHVVCTYISGQGSKIYINGTDVGASRTQGVVSGSIRSSPGIPLFIGARNSTLDFFNGTLDEVKIYPVALTQQQINQTYYQTMSFLTGPTTHLFQLTSAVLLRYLLMATSPLLLCAVALSGKKKKRNLLKLSFPFSLV